LREENNKGFETATRLRKSEIVYESTKHPRPLRHKQKSESKDLPWKTPEKKSQNSRKIFRGEIKDARKWIKSMTML
jgi:hypothetical protein